MKVPSVIAVLWVVSLGVTWMLASSRGPEPPAPNKSTAATAVIMPGSPAPGSPGSWNLQETASRVELAALLPEDPMKPIPRSEIREYIGLALQSEDVVGRNMILASMLSCLDENNVLEALRAFEESPRFVQTDYFYRLFLYVWAKIDGRAALAYLNDNLDARKVEGGELWAMWGWAQTDPEAALAYFDWCRSRKRSSRGMFGGLVRGMARVDLETADTLLTRCETVGCRWTAIEELVEARYEQQGVNAALDWVTSLVESDSTFAERAVEVVVREMSDRDPMNLSLWFLENKMKLPAANGESGVGLLLGTVAQGLSSRYPQLAADFVRSNLDTYDLEAKYVGNTVDQIAIELARHGDVEAATGWLAEMSEPGKKVFGSGSLHVIGSKWAERDPDVALSWASGLDYGEQKYGAFSGIEAQLQEEKREAFRDWILIHDTALESSANRMVDLEPEKALAEARRISDRTRRDETLSSIARRAMRTNPDVVKAWVPNSGLSEYMKEKLLLGR